MSNFFQILTEKKSYSTKLQECISKTVDKLLSNETSIHRPGMLLGKIQSGKTNAFIGIIALAFDKGYDFAIVLTKGTKALAKQTCRRILTDFDEFTEGDEISVFDIMFLPDNLTRYERDQKIIIVAKKEKNNLVRILKALGETYPDLIDKKALIIDDEADYASVGFKEDEKEGFELKKIACLIDSLRDKVSTADFLQVTATPYSLYLQPEDIEINNELFKPIRPAFTSLVPTFPEYIGGDYYFSEEKDEESISGYIYREVQVEELDVLRKEDRRVFKLEEVLTNPRICSFRDAIMNFIVGGCTRHLQQRKAGEKEFKYSFIIHTEIGKQKHAWQLSIVTELKEQLIENAAINGQILDELILKSYENLSKSLKLMHYEIPSYSEVKEEVCNVLRQDYVMITKVNSERDINELLDEKKCQLKLRNPFNIFIGGQILDRGITIENLIGFFYGRRPNRFQQDTVLQHSRMYGNRRKEDLAVTRFYTTIEIYEAMKKIHEFDKALREAFEKGHDEGVIFIRKDLENRIVPCSPNKILLSTITTLKPFKRLLPIGFQTGFKTNIRNVTEQLDNKINSFSEKSNNKPFLISYKDAQEIVMLISETLEFEKGYDWDISAFQSSIEYLSVNSLSLELKGQVWVIVRTNREIKRKGSLGRFEDAPDTPRGEYGEAKIAREIALDIPALILLRQNGKEENGWRGSPFWWPVLIVPKNTKTVIFASDTIEDTLLSYESNPIDK